MAQMSRVAAVEGDTLKLARPLYWNFTRSPSVVPITMLEGAGALIKCN